MAGLFGRERSVIAKQVHSVFWDGELEAKSVCANFARTPGETKTQEELDLAVRQIVSRGRVRRRGGHFRGGRAVKAGHLDPIG
jgi:hypothetical protein